MKFKKIKNGNLTHFIGLDSVITNKSMREERVVEILDRNCQRLNKLTPKTKVLRKIFS